MRSLLGNLGCRFFSLITLHMFCSSLLAWRVSIERSAAILMGIPLCVICFFSLVAFIFVLCVWSLLIWLICMLGCFTMGLSCLRPSGFLGLGWLFPSPFYWIFNYYLLKYLLMAFLFFFFFWDSYESNVGVFIIVPEVSEVVLIPFNFFFSLSFIYFHHSIFHLTYPIFCLSYSTVGFLQSAFDLLYCIIHYWLTLLFLPRPC